MVHTRVCTPVLDELSYRTGATTCAPGTTQHKAGNTCNAQVIHGHPHATHKHSLRRLAWCTRRGYFPTQPAANEIASFFVSRTVVASASFVVLAFPVFPQMALPSTVTTRPPCPRAPICRRVGPATLPSSPVSPFRITCVSPDPADRTLAKRQHPPHQRPPSLRTGGGPPRNIARESPPHLAAP